MPGSPLPVVSLRLVRVFAWLVALSLALPGSAAYISEIDQAGPAGRHIELSEVDPASAYTLLILDGNPFSAFSFGRVLDVIHLPVGSGLGGVATVSDAAWPGGSVATLPLSTLSPASGSSTLDLGFTRLLVVMEGHSGALRFDQPTTDSAAAARYDASAVTDWLVLGDAPGAAWYGGAFDLPAINSVLGIALPDRVVDKQAGRVIARASVPGQPIDLDQFVVGDPDSSGTFVVDADYAYRTTPGALNPPLVPRVPEPGGLAGLVLLGLWLRRDCSGRPARL